MRITLIRSARGLSSLMCTVLFVTLLPHATGQTPLQDLALRVGIEMITPGQSGAKLKAKTSNSLPWNRLTTDQRTRMSDLLDKCHQYRRLPELQFVVEPEVYQYLIQHPDVAVSTWRAMSISKVQLWQTGPFEFEGESPDGSQGVADVLYRDDSQCVLLCEGSYSSPLLPKSITAAALLWMRYEFHPTRNGRQQVHQKTDVFVTFPSAATRTVALLASPITNMMMDRNVYEVSLYARMMSQAAIRDPEWVEQLAFQLDGVLPQRRQELAALVRRPETTIRGGGAHMTARSAQHPVGLPMMRRAVPLAAESNRAGTATIIRGVSAPRQSPAITGPEVSIRTPGPDSLHPGPVLYFAPAGQSVAVPQISREQRAGRADDVQRLTASASPPADSPKISAADLDPVGTDRGASTRGWQARDPGHGEKPDSDENDR